MTLTAQFVVYGRNIDELTEAAKGQGEQFFRCHADEITLEELRAVPVVYDGEGSITRWKADIKIQKVEEEDDD